MRVKKSRGEIYFQWIVWFIVLITLVAVLYPLYFILIASVSDPLEVSAGRVVLFPRGFNLTAYKTILNNPSIWIGLKNTFLYTVVGTSMSVTVTFMGAYALSRKKMPGRNAIMFFIIFTMFFNGGLIPTYMQVKNLNLLDTFWIMVLMNLVSVFHLIVTRSFLQSTIDEQLYDACYIDGGSDFTAFFKIACPLSKPILAVLVLVNAVGHWNSYFYALIFLRDRARYPLSLFMREILMQNMSAAEEIMGTDLTRIYFQESLKYSLIIVSIVPMLILYLFLQKYFKKGIMIGAIKG